MRVTCKVTLLLLAAAVMLWLDWHNRLMMYLAVVFYSKQSQCEGHSEQQQRRVLVRFWV
jgi:hypothetical protein